MPENKVTVEAKSDAWLQPGEATTEPETIGLSLAPEQAARLAPVSRVMAVELGEVAQRDRIVRVEAGQGRERRGVVRQEQRAGIDPASRRVDGVVVPRLQLRRVLDIRLAAHASADATAATMDEALGLILATLGLVRILVWQRVFHTYGPHASAVALPVAVSLVGIVTWAISLLKR